MPFDIDPSYTGQVTAKLSVEGLIDWLRTQDLMTEYDYDSNCDCLLHRYLRTIVGAPLSVGGITWDDRDGHRHHLPENFQDISADPPYTYAAALSRALRYSHV